MTIINFILISAIFIIGGNLTVKLIYSAMQPDGFLDEMFGYQELLDKWYGKAANGSKFHLFLHNAFGGCPKCTAFWFQPLWMTAYYFFCRSVIGWFITDTVDSLLGKLFVCILWLWILQVIGAMVGLFFILIKNKKK